MNRPTLILLVLDSSHSLICPAWLSVTYGGFSYIIYFDLFSCHMKSHFFNIIILEPTMKYVGHECNGCLKPSVKLDC